MNPAGGAGFFGSREYQSLAAAEKLNSLWSQVIAETSGPREPYWVEFPDLFNISTGTFGNESDEMRSRRLKLVHTQGVVFKARWVSTNDHEYTGMYDAGNSHVLVRFSETTNLNAASGGLLPSVAIKLLRDNVKSTNIVAMPSFVPSDSWNFFHEPMKTRVAPFDPIDHFYDYHTVRVNLAENSPRPFVGGVS